MTDALREYLANASKEQLAKDWEDLKEFNESGMDVLTFLEAQQESAYKCNVTVGAGMRNGYEYNPMYYLAV